MAGLLRDLSVRRKLPLIVTATSGAALLLACGAFLGYDQVTSRRSAAKAMGMMADVLSAQVAVAAAFDDARGAVDVLAPLVADPQILAAGVYRKDGRLLGEFRRTPEDRPPPSETPRESWRGRGLEISRPVLQESRNIGTLTMKVDLAPLRERLRTGVLLVLGIWAAASTGALLLSLKLGGMITRPILHLAETVRDVTARETYDVRAVPQGRDETGQLIDGFNAMLARIRDRDAALQSAKSELERKVAELTEIQQRLAEQQAELATYHDLVTHDVTNFAGTLMVIVEHLLSRPAGTFDPQTRDLLRRANRQVFQLNRLATNAKALHRVLRKGLPAGGPQVALGGILRRVVDTVRSVHFDRPFEAEVDCPEGLTLREIPFMENVFLNLVDNAVKHTPKDELPKIRATAVAEGGRVRIRVRGGAPADAELRAKLFERYARGPQSTGAGLGLAVVREIVVRAGGSMAVANAVNGDGTEHFEVTLELPEA